MIILHSGAQLNTFYLPCDSFPELFKDTQSLEYLYWINVEIKYDALFLFLYGIFYFMAKIFFIWNRFVK